MKITYFLIAAALTSAACSTSTDQKDSKVAGPKNFGAALSEAKITTFSSVKNEAMASGLSNGKIEGTILETCAKKGCWMEVATGTDTLFVKFKDYGFFVPTEGVEGMQTTIEGVATLDTVSVDELQHYAEDAGKSPEEIAAITQEEYKVRFVANGVEIK
jgi:hypothetical protein